MSKNIFEDYGAFKLNVYKYKHPSNYSVIVLCVITVPDKQLKSIDFFFLLLQEN